MKIFYFSMVSKNEIGVFKKIKYQIKALKKNNEVKYSYINDNKLFFLDKYIYDYKKGFNILSKILNKFQEIKIFNKLKNKELYKETEIVYIRYIYTYPWRILYYKFLKEIGKILILEVPTYPYDEELKEGILKKVDEIYRMKLYKYIDRIVTYSIDKEIWGIPCINISNGIDLDEVKIINKNLLDKNEIRFIIVSNCSCWHGIDRFLYSILEYKKNDGDKKIKFNIVGKGKESINLKKIVKENPILQDIVIFHGFKSGKDLDEIYNNTDIGIGSLAAFRQGLEYGSALKNREYAAKGLPFINGDIDVPFMNQRFVYQVTNDDTLINIEEIIKWYENLNMEPQEIRKFAEDNLSWEIQMKKVMDNIREMKKC